MNKELPYELLPSENQKLTFESLKTYLLSLDIHFNVIQQKVLRLKNAEDKFTNLGFWVSDQFNIRTKVVVYQGENMAHYDTNQEYGCSIIKQIQDIEQCLKEFNNVRSSFVNNHRIDIEDYPINALREALLNAFIHQDYSFQSSIMVKIYEDHIEISNFGSLLKNMSYDDVFIGMSICRNNALMNLFKFIKLSKALGTGIGEIRDSYNTCITFPKIRLNENIFKISLPNKYFGSRELSV